MKNANERKPELEDVLGAREPSAEEIEFYDSLVDCIKARVAILISERADDADREILLREIEALKKNRKDVAVLKQAAIVSEQADRGLISK